MCIRDRFSGDLNLNIKKSGLPFSRPTATEPLGTAFSNKIDIITEQRSRVSWSSNVSFRMPSYPKTISVSRGYSFSARIIITDNRSRSSSSLLSWTALPSSKINSMGISIWAVSLSCEIFSLLSRNKCWNSSSKSLKTVRETTEFFRGLSWKSCSGDRTAGKFALMLSTTCLVFFSL